jgi:hypothetical protein
LRSGVAVNSRFGSRDPPRPYLKSAKAMTDSLFFIQIVY